MCIRDRRREPFFVAGELLQFDFRFFHLVNGVVGLFEAFQVAGAEILRIGDFGDFFERGLVNFVAAQAEAKQSAAARTSRARADGINFNSQGGGGLRGILGRHAPRVIDAVRQQNHNFGLGLGVAQAVDARSDGVADGGCVFEHAGLEAFDLQEEPGAVSYTHLDVYKRQG